MRRRYNLLSRSAGTSVPGNAVEAFQVAVVHNLHQERLCRNFNSFLSLLYSLLGSSDFKTSYILCILLVKVDRSSYCLFEHPTY